MLLKKSRTYKLMTSGIFLLLLLAAVRTGMAQQSDTSRTRHELQQNHKTIPQSYNSDRSTHKYLMPKSGQYKVPSPTTHYTPPFEGQKSLDRAVAAYHKELEKSIVNSPIYQIISKIAPFINNVFVFGYYDQTAPVIGPDNPYLYPQTAKGQKRSDNATPQPKNKIEPNNSGKQPNK
jgi:hypothetical protein